MKLHSRRNGGFTLLELLVASAMVAMLAASLYSMMFIAFKARNRALTAVDSVRKQNMTADFMRADLRAAVIPNPKWQPDLATPSPLAGPFVGTSGQGIGGAGGDDLTFYASVVDNDLSAGVGDIKMIEYCLEPASGNNKGAVLVRKVTSNLLAPNAVDPTVEVLARGVKTFTLQYFDGTVWQAQWDSTATTPANILPLAVQMTIEFDDSSGAARAPISRVLTIPCGTPVSTSGTTGGGG